MNRYNLQEVAVAEYQKLLKSYSREELLSELVEVKCGQLDKLSDEALMFEMNVQRRK